MRLGQRLAPQRISAMALAGRRVGSGRACDTYLFDVVVDPQKHDAHKHSGNVGQASVVALLARLAGVLAQRS